MLVWPGALRSLGHVFSFPMSLWDPASLPRCLPTHSELSFTPCLAVFQLWSLCKWSCRTEHWKGSEPEHFSHECIYWLSLTAWKLHFTGRRVLQIHGVAVGISIVSFKSLVFGTWSVLSKRTLISIPLKQPTVAAIVQSLSCIWLFVTPWTAPYQAPLSPTISPNLPKSMLIEFVKLSNHSIHPLLFLFPFAFYLSQHQILF